ncbi:MAG: hypothetical protein ACOCWG_05535 [bacterium]
MKKTKILYIVLLLFMIAVSCQKEDSATKDPADIFEGLYMGPDQLEIKKIDANSVDLIFTHSEGSDWNHTFYATVDGKKLTIPAWQNWESEGLKVSGDGFLAGNVLTINYYYSSGFKELGVTYDKIN